MNTENVLTELNGLVEKYSTQLDCLGVKCVIHRKHFQLHPSHEPHATANSGLFFILDEAYYKFRMKFIPYQDNDYNCVVLRFEPLDNSVKNRFIKEYSYLIQSREDTKNFLVDYQKVLSRAEKCINKTIKMLKNSSPEKVCSDKLIDALRYSSSIKYSYKKEYLGKSKVFWETIFNIFTIIFIGAISLLFVVLL